MITFSVYTPKTKVCVCWVGSGTVKILVFQAEYCRCRIPWPEGVSFVVLYTKWLLTKAILILPLQWRQRYLPVSVSSSLIRHLRRAGGRSLFSMWGPGWSVVQWLAGEQRGRKWIHLRMWILWPVCFPCHSYPQCIAFSFELKQFWVLNYFPYFTLTEATRFAPKICFLSDRID